MARPPLSPQESAALKFYRHMQRALTVLVTELSGPARQDQDHPKSDDPRAPKGMVAAVCATMDRIEETFPAIKPRASGLR